MKHGRRGISKNWSPNFRNRRRNWTPPIPVSTISCWTPVKVEVKASRAVDFDSDEPLYVKALASDSSKRFDMNFQQVKPACCDVFVWIGVWRDVIRHWVLASKEMGSSRYYSAGQHRGNVGEGQLHLRDDNIREFSAYEVQSNQIAAAIRNAYQRQIHQ